MAQTNTAKNGNNETVNIERDLRRLIPVSASSQAHQPNDSRKRNPTQPTHCHRFKQPASALLASARLR